MLFGVCSSSTSSSQSRQPHRTAAPSRLCSPSPLPTPPPPPFPLPTPHPNNNNHQTSYITCAVQVLAAFTDKAWWLYAAIPAYGAYKLWTGILCERTGTDWNGLGWVAFWTGGWAGSRAPRCLLSWTCPD